MVERFEDRGGSGHKTRERRTSAGSGFVKED